MTPQQQRIHDFFEKNPKGVAIIRWATATGKSSLSIETARHDPSIEIISADSRQIYTQMNIGTDTVSDDIIQTIPHHQINIVDPDTTYTAWQRKEDVTAIITDIHNRWKKALIVWGTWLYIDTIYKNFAMPEVAPDMERREKMMEKEEQSPWFLMKQLQIVDPDEALKHHPNSLRYILRAVEIYEKTWTPKSVLAKQRPVQWPLLLLWLRREKEDTNKRINARIKQMVEEWLIWGSTGAARCLIHNTTYSGWTVFDTKRLFDISKVSTEKIKWSSFSNVILIVMRKDKEVGLEDISLKENNHQKKT